MAARKPLPDHAKGNILVNQNVLVAILKISLNGAAMAKRISCAIEEAAAQGDHPRVAVLAQALSIRLESGDSEQICLALHGLDKLDDIEGVDAVDDPTIARLLDSYSQGQPIAA